MSKIELLEIASPQEQRLAMTLFLKMGDQLEILLDLAKSHLRLRPAILHRLLPLLFIPFFRLFLPASHLLVSLGE